ncbi:MAG: hypothetical protein IPL49_18485 [Saprospirales bacterium]|nr:hypothetical protein [Saprospirales bacterium]MBK8492810.1 hypothetical protein [Saprospirales bacterium]
MTLRMLTFIFLVGLSFASCKNDAAATSETPETSTQGITPQALETPQAPAATTVSNPNPPHGQPNHRCDIPVGASLDTPPQPTGSSTSPVFQNQAPPANAQQAPAATNVSNPNPPHGQPNHRCDIPVGASLDTPAGQ